MIAGGLLVASVALPPDARAQESESAGQPEAWRSRTRVHPTETGAGPVTAPAAARRDAEPRGIEPEDVALAVPRTILAVPAFLIRVAYLLIKGGLYLLGRYTSSIT